MKFKKTTIPPEGRNKYGNYVSSGNVTKAVINSMYYGNSTGGNNGVNRPDDPAKEPEDSFLLFLSKTSGTYDGRLVAVSDVTETIEVIGYKNLSRCDTYVGDILGETEGNAIEGIVEGMTVTINNNGTPNTSISITISSGITESNGTLRFPCNVYRKSVSGDPLGDDADAWTTLKDNCSTLWLEYNWDMVRPATEAYSIELTNEIAAINCDKDGNIYANAVRPTCQAYMYYGSEEVEGETYSISTDSDRNAVGVSINTQTGVLTFGSNFSFDGTTLEVVVTGNANGAIHSKVMTIIKQYPGADGTPATTRWVVPSANVILFNPNTNTITPSAISCKVMKQEGEDSPVEDTSTTLYYGWDTETPTSVYSTSISVDASKNYLAFALKNSDSEIYEIETIPIIPEGKNGTDGTNGQSVYNLVLSNNNASINCDSDGNILSTAYRPKCTAKLYYGNDIQTGATYEYTTNITATGITLTQGTTGATISLGSDFNFTAADVLEITITAKIGGVIYGTAIMSISKNYAGKDGVDGNNGTDGTPGKDGVGISTTAIQYGISSSETTQPSSWSNSVPTLTKGYYLWTKTTWTYTDGTTETGYQKTYISKDGNDGTDGLPGKDGVGISATTIVYGLSSSNTTQPSSWTSSVPTLVKGYYLWTKTTWTYTDNTTEVGYQKTYIGTDGSDGADGTDGADGADAVTYWLDLSTTEVVVNKSGTASPSSVTLKAYKQVGGNTPVDITSSSTIKYGYNTATPTTVGTTISSIDTSKNYIMVHLIYNGTIYDRQTIAILKDGADGADGAQGEQGLQGASLRGPYDWKDITSTRRFCNGKLTNASYPEDAYFIDVVKYNDTYYYCHTSYNGKGSETTAPSTTYWTTSSQDFDFVATNLLLAENGQINFSSSNQLTLLDSEGNITAGAQGGDGISFWAGASEPSNGNFRVSYDGTLEATKGKFGILEIGNDGYGYEMLKAERTYDAETNPEIYTLSMQPDRLIIESVNVNYDTSSMVMITSNAYSDAVDTDGDIWITRNKDISDPNDWYNAVSTEGLVQAAGFYRRLGGTQRYAPFMPVNEFQITFVTDTNYFTKSNDQWYWKGNPTGQYAGTYGYVKIINGEWCYTSTSTATSGIGTGIYTSDHAKENNRLYIEF